METSDENTIEIARRARKNLDFIDTQYGLGAPVYEFTQLFNSMLGILVCLREEYYIGSSIEWSDVELRGLSVSATLKQKSDKFSQLVSNARHALAHSNYEFIGHNRKIIGIKLWNVPSHTDPNNRKKPAYWTWQADFTEHELREIANLVLNYLECYFGLDVNADPTDLPDISQ